MSQRSKASERGGECGVANLASQPREGGRRTRGHPRGHPRASRCGGVGGATEVDSQGLRGSKLRNREAKGREGYQNPLLLNPYLPTPNSPHTCPTNPRVCDTQLRRRQPSHTFITNPIQPNRIGRGCLNQHSKLLHMHMATWYVWLT